jgi:hypothetical protein
VQLACTHGNDFALLRFLLGRVGYNDAAPDGLLFLDTFDNDSIL